MIKNMKQAVLIMVHKNVEQLNHLINYFNDQVNIYVHVDKKSKNLLPKIVNKKNVTAISEYSINWGGFNNVKASLLLSEIALKVEENSSFHLISGEDYPCALNCESFLHITNVNSNYLDFFSLPYVNWSNNGGLDRVNKYHLNDKLDARNKEDLFLLHNFVKGQIYSDVLLPRKDFTTEFELELFGGSNWWSLSRQLLQYVIEFTKKNKKIYHRFEYTFCSDEIYYQTILLNSPFAKEIINDNMRYIDWHPRNGGSIPCYLDDSDFISLTKKNYLFARKFSLECINRFVAFQNKLIKTGSSF